MALTREEVSVRLGIDSSSLMKGLDSTTNYLSRWRNKQKTAEQDYTDFWKRELEKRDQAEITGATRRNRARALWRERAAKREAASELRLIQEAESNKSFLVQKSMQALGSKAISLLKTNVYFAAFDLIRSVIPTVEEFWNKIYGVDEESQNKRKEAFDNIAALKKAAIESRDALNKQRASNQFRSAGKFGQEAMLEGDLSLASEKTSAAGRHLKLMRQTKASDEERYQALTKFNEALLEQEDIQFRLAELRKTFSTGELIDSVGRRIRGERKSVFDARLEIDTGRRLGDVAMENSGRGRLSRNIRNQKEIFGEITNPVVDLLSMIGRMPFGGAVGGALATSAALQAQTEAMAEALRKTNVNVIIKGVDGP